MTDMDIPLPEPLDCCYEWDGPYGSRKFSAALHNGRPPDRSVAIYSADQVRAAIDAAVQRERERCAKAAEDFLTRGRSPIGRSVAAAIRASSAKS